MTTITDPDGRVVASSGDTVTMPVAVAEEALHALGVITAHGPGQAFRFEPLAHAAAVEAASALEAAIVGEDPAPEASACGAVRPQTLGYQQCVRPLGHTTFHRSQDGERWMPSVEGVPV